MIPSNLPPFCLIQPLVTYFFFDTFPSIKLARVIEKEEIILGLDSEASEDIVDYFW